MFSKTLLFTAVVVVLSACASESRYPRYHAWDPYPSTPSQPSLPRNDHDRFSYHSPSDGRPGVDTAQLRMERERSLMRSQAESRGIPVRIRSSAE